MCEKIAQLTKVVSNLHSETEDAREREKELEEEQSNAIELCRADAARKILETHSKWHEEVNEKERFERIANDLEAKTCKMQSVVDDALREIIREAESKSDALNKKMGELEILFKQSEKKEMEQKRAMERNVSETNEKIVKEMELRQSLEEEKTRIEREKREWESKAEHLERSMETRRIEFENKVNELKTAEKKYEEIVEEYKILETKGKESVRALIKEHESQTALNAEKFKRGCETLEKNFQKESLLYREECKQEVDSVREALETRLRRQIDACDVLTREVEALKENVRKERSLSEDLQTKLQNEINSRIKLQDMSEELKKRLDDVYASREGCAKKNAEQLSVIETLERRLETAVCDKRGVNEELCKLEDALQATRLALQNEEKRARELESTNADFELRHVQTRENSMAISKQHKEELFQLDSKLRREHESEIEIMQKQHKCALEDALTSRHEHLQMQKKDFERKSALANEEMTEKLRQANEENKMLTQALREHESQASKFEHTIQELGTSHVSEVNRLNAERRTMSLEAEASRARETNFREEILSLQKENERANEAVRNVKEEMNTRLREARDIFNEEKEALCVSFERSHKSALIDAEKVLDSEKRKADLAFENKTRTMNEDFTRRLSREIDEAIEATKNIHDAEMQDMITVHERKLVDMNAEKERVIREIESDREETIAQLNRSHEGTVSNLRKELEESARANEAKISGMEVYFQSQTKQITTSYQNNLEESLRALESRLENIRISENKAWAKSLEEVKMAHQSDVDESNARESALLSKIQALNDQISAERSVNALEKEKLSENHRDFISNLRKEHRNYVEHMKTVHRDIIEEERLTTESANASSEKWKLKYNARESRESDVRKIRMLETELSKATADYNESERKLRAMQEEVLRREISCAKGIGFDIPTLRTKEGIVTIDRSKMKVKF